jgi:CrcB protein
MNWSNMFLVFIGGGAGSILRYLLGIALPAYEGFPLPTFAVNLVGSGLLGMLSAWLYGQGTSGLYLALAIGFCGGFTTFSTFSMEAIRLWESGRMLMGFLYTFGSLAGGLVLYAGGFFLTRAWH